MEYQDIVKAIVEEVLKEANVTDEKVKVGNDTYHFASLRDVKDRKGFLEKLAKQNKEIDARREAQA